MSFARLDNRNTNIDRFIGQRSDQDLAYTYSYKEELMTRMEVDSPQKGQKEKNQYQAALKNQVLGVDDPELISQINNDETENSPGMLRSSQIQQLSRSAGKDMSRSKKMPKRTFSYLDEENQVNSFLKRALNMEREISKTPFKVLDAPALKDDYYLNLLDWSS